MLANPNLAFILMTLGTLGLLYELASPGVGIAGTVGALSLVLGLFSLAILPAGMPLRTLGSLVDASSREGTVLVFPVPLELMRLAGGPNQG